VIRHSIATAVRNIVRQVNRSRAALTSVAIGVVVIILAAGFIDWNLRFGRENTIHSQLGHVQIMKAGFLEKGRANPYEYLFNDKDLGQLDLSQLPDSQVVASRLQLSGLVSSGEVTLSFIGEGVDPEAEVDLSSGLRFIAGGRLPANDANTVIVGQGLAENLGAQVGGRIVLITNTENGAVNAVEARVVGVFQSIAKAYDDVALRIPLPLARQLVRTDGEHLKIVLLNHTSETDDAVKWLAQRLDAKTFDVVPWSDMADFYKKTAALFAKQVGVIDILIALIIVLSISNTMTMSALQRVGEIGTMMAMGTRSREILLLFVAEGVCLGILGAIIGLVLGVVLALVISAIGIPMPPGPGMAWGYDAGILLSFGNLAKAAAIAVLTTGLASLYPAWRASRMNIVDALRALQ